MSAILGMGGVEPAQKLQDTQKQAQVNFDAADTNQDGIVSASEFMQILSAEGVEASKASEFTKTIDTDGDGNISSQEHQKLLQEMEGRVSKLMTKMEGGPDGYSTSPSEQVKEFEALKTMMSSVATDTKNEQNSKDLSALLEQLNTEGYSKEGVQNAMELLNKVAPPINTMV
ncbi:MAG: EF-hand domain-containing protein [Paraglaciecola sp.]|uniref:EF-hand domain-containing protein n=1 Tax=Paraglaciecola sp. TaxID=1920173 RepID=UPI00273E1D16|nr:EF-hand domain-containing protein [Paraglaciecola sp.]MDP5030487.1 EF-hand domain-containing protein [Paraglaciecola sp.]MDP5041601.1 EF-hand domain-containing protein [Paraglaciecola sp.]MDP5131997.1 EF-hand domain-containing protein [Paraglaciecola sp.]